MNLFKFEITDEVMVLDLSRVDAYSKAEIQNPFMIGVMATVMLRNLNSEGKPIYKIKGDVVSNDQYKECCPVTYYYSEDMLEKISEVSALGVKVVLDRYKKQKFVEKKNATDTK